MREFVVTLRGGMRYTVRAERFRFEYGYVAFVVPVPAAVADQDPFAGVVALFDQPQVAVVVARENLVAEEKGEPVTAPHLVPANPPGDDIPF